jgi:glucose-1-phosphate thymidylyltransferase
MTGGGNALKIIIYNFIMKGIILAGGIGSRLYPVTKIISKQLIPIYDKPMIYYPLSVLMLAQIKEILIITTPRDNDQFKKLLGDGSEFGIKLSYAIQASSDGIAQAFIIGKKFIGNNEVCLILGDNFFYGQGFPDILKKAIKNLNGATIFGYRVDEPERFGIVEIDKNKNIINIEEKPLNFKSDIAVTGLYLYDNSVIKIAEKIRPSDRGELEITSINKKYLDCKKISLEILGRGFVWFDMGISKTILEASQYAEIVENKQKYKIACLEEIAWRNKWIDDKKIIEKTNEFRNSTYVNYLKKLIS